MRLFIKDACSETGRFMEIKEVYSRTAMCHKKVEIILGEIETRSRAPLFIDRETGEKKRFKRGEFKKAVEFGDKYYNTHTYQLKNKS